MSKIKKTGDGYIYKNNIPQVGLQGWWQWSGALGGHQSSGHLWGAVIHWPCDLGRVEWCHQHLCELWAPLSALASDKEGSC